jgi:RNA 2',3'-cyclic 3'-phosphodiesterase
MESQLIRAFFAIKPPRGSLDEIEAATRELRKSFPNSIKWIPPDSQHITLKFMGAFNLSHASTIHTDLKKNLSKFGAFSFSIQTIGVFPNPKYSKILRLGVNDGNQIIRLAKFINSSISHFGYKDENRHLSPHITIGRVKKSISFLIRQQIGEKVQNYKIPLMKNIDVEKISLIQSDLSPKGPIYSTLFEISL